MKYLFLILLLNFTSSSYYTTTNNDFPCNKILVTTTDDMTGKTNTSTRNFVLTGNVKWLFIRYNNRLLLSATINNRPCIDRNSKMIFKLDNDEQIRFYNYLDFNCKGRSTVALKTKGKRNLKQIEPFLKHRIKKIRLYQENGYKDVVLTTIEQIQVQQVLKCLME